MRARFYLRKDDLIEGDRQLYTIGKRCLKKKNTLNDGYPSNEAFSKIKSTIIHGGDKVFWSRHLLT